MGRLSAEGKLTNIWERPPTYADDVPLADHPAEVASEYRYDAVRKLARPARASEVSVVAKLTLPRIDVRAIVAALLVVRDPRSKAAEVDQCRVVLDTAADGVLALLRQA